ncbi:alpha/beta hydrolase [Gordonia amicalis]|uniref:Alpha/beta hydrolase n=1 Tax=Gordonia amicalis TaxID=89053 RepID=A0AAE4R5F2_9ACTN|nr:alpha/beta hydrolase [Gordonia amicalis]MCZ4579499.1 alpha/beta hydrolase [Gordonia amicalis]MDJ0452090.1 alpha/beta hydrolase [Gordonia amicalis]MDV6312028.1 alpha/beta hydrolase [Gordonia amicalis]MDV7076921.1 alpha/beta hydrolase [Gordonia amicalis]
MSRDTYLRLSLPARIQRGVLLAAGRIPGAALSALGRRASVNSDGERVAPELAAIGWANQHVPGLDPFQGEVARSRSATDESGASMAENLPPMAVEEDLVIDGPAGPIPATRYRSSTESGGLLVYFHGGGFVTGSRISHDTFVRRLAHGTGLDVLSVEYRLAPEHPFPAGVEDAVAAWHFAVDVAPRWGLDPRRIVVAGDSAGANLATVVARLVRDEPATPVFQLLIYPVTDLSAQTPSRREFATGFFLTTDGIEWFNDHYVPDLEQRSDPRCSPLLADDLGGLPPAHVIVAGFDPLRDEGLAYAKRLEEAGVPVTLRREGSMIHGFVNMTLISPGARAAVDRMCAEVRRALDGAPPADQQSIAG